MISILLYACCIAIPALIVLDLFLDYLNSNRVDCECEMADCFEDDI